MHPPSPLRNEIANTPDFWSILESLHKFQEGASGAFQLVEMIVNGPPSTITADNYEAAITLLKDFATAGSTGAIIEQKREKVARRSKVLKQPGSQ